MRLRYVPLLLTMLVCAACQDTADPTPPTPAPTATAVPALALFPTRESRAIITSELSPTSVITPSLSTLTMQPTDERQMVAASPAPTWTASVPIETTTIGYSVEGRPIDALRIGEGTRVVMLVGGMHGGWEANTVDLVEALIAHFTAYPGAVMPGSSLVFIAAANPDGLQHGRTAAGRFNANGVDLNRNWGCEWSAEAVWRSQTVYPGATAFSEPETRALAEYIRTLRPDAAIFYHSAANGVYAGDCDSDTAADSAALAAVLGAAADYRYGQPFSAYPVTGTAPNWVDGLGIPSVDVELRTSTDAEFAQNLRGVMAAQAWVLGQ